MRLKRTIAKCLTGMMMVLAATGCRPKDCEDTSRDKDEEHGLVVAHDQGSLIFYFD